MNKSQLIEELSKRVGNDKEEIRYILEEPRKAERL